MFDPNDPFIGNDPYIDPRGSQDQQWRDLYSGPGWQNQWLGGGRQLGGNFQFGPKPVRQHAYATTQGGPQSWNPATGMPPPYPLIGGYQPPQGYFNPINGPVNPWYDPTGQRLNQQLYQRSQRQQRRMGQRGFLGGGRMYASAPQPQMLGGGGGGSYNRGIAYGVR